MMSRVCCGGQNWRRRNVYVEEGSIVKWKAREHVHKQQTQDRRYDVKWQARAERAYTGRKEQE
jgi:hypothetical protein